MPLTNSIQTAEDAYLYARDVIKGRFLEGEAIIATDPEYAYYYACDGIKGRWLDGELQILFSEYAIKYAELCETSILLN